MKRVLLDTNVAGFALSDKPEFSSYKPFLEDVEVEVSFQTVAEMLDGARKRGLGGKRRRSLLAFIERLAVVPYSFELAQEYAHVRDLSRRQGRELTAPDSWVAAAAIYRRAKLLTHDTDFVGVKIPGLNVVCFA